MLLGLRHVRFTGESGWSGEWEDEAGELDWVIRVSFIKSETPFVYVPELKFKKSSLIFKLGECSWLNKDLFLGTR